MVDFLDISPKTGNLLRRKFSKAKITIMIIQIHFIQLAIVSLPFWQINLHGLFSADDIFAEG